MNKKKTDTKHVSQELHSNLMITTTFFAMVGFALLMVISMSMRNYNLVMLTIKIATIGGIAAFAVAAYLAYRAVKNKFTYLLEYIIYCMILGFGLTFMFNVPAFLVNFVMKYSISWASYSLAGLMILTGVFFVGSVAWHGVLASPKRRK